MSVRQIRHGWIQECLGCEAADEFKWFDATDGKNDQFATSLEESDCCPRMCCGGCHEFTMVAKEEGSGEEILTMHRPWVRHLFSCFKLMLLFQNTIIDLHSNVYLSSFFHCLFSVSTSPPTCFQTDTTSFSCSLFFSGVHENMKLFELQCSKLQMLLFPENDIFLPR